jgi:hypothetical protein
MWELDTIVLQGVELKCEEYHGAEVGEYTREWVRWLELFLSAPSFIR